MAFPDEILAGPCTVWAAPTGTAKPDVSITPPVAWIKLGAQGDKNITENGVHMFHEQNLNMIRMLGATAPIKAFPDSEDERIEFELADLNLEMISIILGNGPATTAAGVITTAPGVSIAGQKNLSMYRGIGAKLPISLLARAPQSAGGGAFSTQWWIPKCVPDSQCEIIWVKDAPAILAAVFTALWDPTNGLGTIDMQTSLAS